jgi:hypothetical protein
LISNSYATSQKLNSANLTFYRKICGSGQSGSNPISCQGEVQLIKLGDLTYGKPGSGMQAFNLLYYVAKPNANNQTPDPFAIYDVSAAGGPANITIPARDPASDQSGIFWLYLYN